MFVVLSLITKLSQINKKTKIAAVAPLGLGGWLIAYLILLFISFLRVYFTNKKTEYLAYHDKLTGLYNFVYLDKEISSSDENTLLLLDINNLSYINIAYGFNVGDKLLMEVASALKNKFSPDTVYRLNSDEFAFLFKSKIDLSECIQRIRKYFHDNIIELDGLSFHISFFYGGVYANKEIVWIIQKQKISSFLIISFLKL